MIEMHVIVALLSLLATIAVYLHYRVSKLEIAIDQFFKFVNVQSKINFDQIEINRMIAADMATKENE